MGESAGKLPHSKGPSGAGVFSGKRRNSEDG